MSREPTAIAPSVDWDRRVSSWEAVADTAAFQRLAREIALLAQPRLDDRVVDLGAGTGLLISTTWARSSRSARCDAYSYPVVGLCSAT